MKIKFGIGIIIFLQLVGCTTMNAQPKVDPLKTSALVIAIAGGALLGLRYFGNEFGKGVAAGFAP